VLELRKETDLARSFKRPPIVVCVVPFASSQNDTNNDQAIESTEQKLHHRELDIENEMGIAWALSGIMTHLQKSYDFAGVSSNNVYWETTDSPIRMIHIPSGKAYVTVINPKYERLAGQSINSTESVVRFPMSLLLSSGGLMWPSLGMTWRGV
jgi:hypothetical protein